MELPQYTYMRAALAIHRDDLVKIKLTYDALSRQHYVHPPHFLRSAATTRPLYPATFVYEPPDSLVNLADSADELDDLWHSDSVVGISMGKVPSARQATQSLTSTLVSHAFTAHLHENPV